MKSKLERKALTDNGSEPLEEDNIPYIADPESSSTAQYKPAAKLAEAISAAARAKLGDVAKKHGGKVPFESTTFKGGKAVTIKGHYNEKGERVITSTSEEEDQKKK
jgi:hypothetical protein